MERRLDAIAPDAIHIATEGPLGHAMRRVCLRRSLPFTTSFHTRFPDYIAQRLPLASRWSSDLAWAWLRRFHAPATAVMTATPTLMQELSGRRFREVKLWTRGVDADLFCPREDATLDLPRPIFLTVGRVAVEKNIEAFLALDLPGTKVVVGDGPARDSLARQYPNAVFLGARHGAALAQVYAAADVFVFPSRTDTFGLVLLEALASGVPVAAFPADAPRDVIGQNPVGVLDHDLRRACLGALDCSREAARDFALKMTWTESARLFLQHVREGNTPERRKRARRLRRSVAA
jgi:glycosyltransferase involved in cell wall biosynthesis